MAHCSKQSEIRAESEGFFFFFLVVFKALSEALRSYAGKAHVHRPSIVLYHTLPEVAPDGDEGETNGHRNGLELSSF